MLQEVYDAYTIGKNVTKIVGHIYNSKKCHKRCRKYIQYIKMLQKVYDAYTVAKCNVLYFTTLFVTNLWLYIIPKNVTKSVS